MAAKNLHTDRLILVPMTYKVVRAILQGESSERDNLGVQISDKWPRQDTLDILHFIEGSMDRGEEPSGFDVWMIVRKDNRTVIGDAGFKGLPNEEGEVEIGFGLIEEEQQKGYGFEAAGSLINWAFSQPKVNKVKADCLIHNTASAKLLRKCGMNEVSRDEEMIYWEIESN